jgi:hypothetical protein
VALLDHLVVAHQRLGPVDRRRADAHHPQEDANADGKRHALDVRVAAAQRKEEVGEDGADGPEDRDREKRDRL